MRSLQLILSFVVLATFAYSQAPPGINYQGVARDLEGKPLVLKEITIRVSILKNSAEGETEYAEIHPIRTNSFGLFTLVIGNGNVAVGNFSFISWAVGSKWLQVELDPSGGNSFHLMGAQQFMSVPYAFYARYSDGGLEAGRGISINNGVINNTGDTDNNPANELNKSLTFGTDDKLKLTDAGGTMEADLSSLRTQQSLQDVLALGNDAGTRRILNIGTPELPADAVTKKYVDDHLSDLDFNDTQDLILTDHNLQITGNESATNINLAPYLDNTDTQTLAFNTSSKLLSISNGNTVALPETQNLNDILTQGTDAGAKKISNLGAPTLANDATTKKYVDDADAVLLSKISTTYAFKTNFAFTNNGVVPINDQVIPLVTDDFDDFNVVAGNSFTALEPGVYVFTIDGSITAGGQISLLYNGTKHSVPVVLPFGGLTLRFNATMMFKMNAGQTVRLVGDNISLLAQYSGSFFGYKL